MLIAYLRRVKKNLDMQGYRYVGASDMASWVHLCSNDLHCIVSRPKKPEALFSTCIAALLHGTVQDTCAIIGSKVLLRSFESYKPDYGTNMKAAERD